MDDPPNESAPAQRAAAPRVAGGPVWLRRVRPYGFVLVPLVALWELFAHVSIVRGVPRDHDWIAARDYIARVRREGDLVASAPWWTDPLARMHFARMISLRDAARPDATSYARAWVATIRGGRHPDFAGWPEVSSQRFGAVTVRGLRNPAPARVRFDFVDALRPPRAEVFRHEPGGDRACDFRDRLRVEGGGLGQGALAGPERYQCGEPWNYVGRTIAEDMDHRGRLCIWSHPVVAVPMRTIFHDVPLANAIRGHHVVAYEAERGGDHGETGAPITLTVYVGDDIIGRDVHADGEGWKLFQFDTRRWANTTQRVTFEVTVEVGGNRHYCFQADAR